MIKNKNLPDSQGRTLIKNKNLPDSQGRTLIKNIIMTPEEQAKFLFENACRTLRLAGFNFQVMKRVKPVTPKKSFRIAYINLKTKKLVLDIYTPRTRSPKKPSVILRTLAHELAHAQRPPYRQLWRGKIINRAHYPRFYKQISKNIAKFKKDKVLSKFFT